MLRFMTLRTTRLPRAASNRISDATRVAPAGGGKGLAQSARGAQVGKGAGAPVTEAFDNDVIPSPPARPKTAQVVGLLAGTALIFSYLASYCLVNALVAAEVMRRWAPGHDPRPKILVGGFVVLMTTFLGIGAAARWVSGRQLRRIDEMEKD